MDDKVQSVLDGLANREKFELEHHERVPHNERMLAITPRIGQFYNILLRATNATRVLEVGTSVGYSTIWFAEALRANSTSSKITTIEADSKKIQRAKKNFEEAGVDDFIEIIHGNAIDILQQIGKNFDKTKCFDFIFIDADKEQYIQYFDACLPLVKVGGLIGADNIMQPKRFNTMMKQYVNHVRKSPKVISETIPIDNGEEISLKIYD